MSTWDALWEMKTARKLTAAEIKDWKDELDHDFSRNKPDDDEIKDALRWAFSRDNVRQFKKKNKYDYNQVFLRILISMWRKEASSSDPGERCDLCVMNASEPPSGWLSFPYVYVGKNGDRKKPVRRSEPTYNGYAAIPCICAAGRKFGDKWDESKKGDLRRLQDLVIKNVREDVKHEVPQ